MTIANGRLLAIVMAVVIFGVVPVGAQSPSDQPVAAQRLTESKTPQTTRAIPGERVPSVEHVQRERLEQELNRREREYLEQIGRMA